MTQRSLMAVFAHPDDEVFGSGGMLARYASQGAKVRVLCATRGESGKITDPSLGEVKDVGALRQLELESACATLGLEPPAFLAYHDSGRGERLRRDNLKALVNADPERLEREVLEHVIAWQPQVMLTFDPHGVYGHPDHVAIHRAATAAFWSAGNYLDTPPLRLYYTVMETAHMARLQASRPNSPLSGLDVNHYGVSSASLAAVLDVSDMLEKKQAAIAAHRSQVGPQSSFAALRDELWAETLRLETFSLGGLRGAFPEMPVDDLFAGL